MSQKKVHLPKAFAKTFPKRETTQFEYLRLIFVLPCDGNSLELLFHLSICSLFVLATARSFQAVHTYDCNPNFIASTSFICLLPVFCALAHNYFSRFKGFKASRSWGISSGLTEKMEQFKPPKKIKSLPINSRFYSLIFSATSQGCSQFIITRFRMHNYVLLRITFYHFLYSLLFLLPAPADLNFQRSRNFLLSRSKEMNFMCSLFLCKLLNSF